MTEIKIIIPMAGIGKRMGQLTRHRPKALVRLADKRLLDHVLKIFEALEKTYLIEYIFIVGYLGEQIREYMKRAHPDKHVTYFVQGQLMGQSHAVYLAKDETSGPIFLTYCDTINETDFSFLPLRTAEGVAFVQEAADPRRHGVAVIGPDNLLVELVEKPQTMAYRSVLTGLYYFSEGRDLIRGIETQMRKRMSLNNEYYLADAINILLDDGMRIGSEKALQWHDAGTPEAILQTNAYLLQSHSESHNEPARGRSNVLIPPLYLHESSRVENSIIGPNVSVGENCVIKGSIIKNAIVDDNSNIIDAMLANSLIGEGCSVTGNPVQSTVGDYDGMRIHCTTDEMNGANADQDS
jgi:glucose-1-phosphate thymidylyltransferase